MYHKKAIIIALACLSMLFACAPKSPSIDPTKLLALLERPPETVEDILHALRTCEDLRLLTYPGDFRCQLVLPIVNNMRHLGKDRVLEILTRYYREDRRTDLYATGEMPGGAIVILSRLLFLPPAEGWKMEYYFNIDGVPLQNSNITQFPLWPIAVSRGVPFLLQGHGNFGGLILDEDKSTLIQCAQLNLIPTDWPILRFDTAAANLIESTPFKELPNYTEIADVIRAQAGIHIVWARDGFPLNELNSPASAIAGLKRNDDRRDLGLPVLPPSWTIQKDDFHSVIWLNPEAGSGADLNPEAGSGAALRKPMHIAKYVVVNTSQSPVKEIDIYQSGKQYHSLYVEPGALDWETLTITYDYGAAARGNNPWSCKVNCGAHERLPHEQVPLIEAESMLRVWGIKPEE